MSPLTFLKVRPLCSCLYLPIANQIKSHEGTLHFRGLVTAVAEWILGFDYRIRLFPGFHTACSVDSVLGRLLFSIVTELFFFLSFWLLHVLNDLSVEFSSSPPLISVEPPPIQPAHPAPLLKILTAWRDSLLYLSAGSCHLKYRGLPSTYFPAFQPSSPSPQTTQGK